MLVALYFHDVEILQFPFFFIRVKWEEEHCIEVIDVYNIGHETLSVES